MGESTRRALEDAAVRLVSENGLEATTADSIARAAGVTERTFFRYFGSKQEAILGYVALRLAYLSTHLDLQGSRKVTLHSLLEALRSHATQLGQDAEYVRRIRIISSDGQLREWLQVERARCAVLISRAIAKHEGIDPDVRTDALARVGVAIVTAATDAWIDDVRSRSLEHYIDEASRTVLG